MTIAKHKHLSATSHNATRQNSSRFCTTMFILVVVALLFSSNNHANDNNAITPATSGISVPSADEQAAAQVLDQLNQYSSSADWDKYFHCIVRMEFLSERMRMSDGEWQNLNTIPVPQRLALRFNFAPFSAAW